MRRDGPEGPERPHGGADTRPRMTFMQQVRHSVMPGDLDPGTRRRKFSKLARRVFRPTTATRVSLVNRCAKGHLHKRPAYLALRS